MDDFVLVAKGSTKALVHPVYREEVAAALLEGEGCSPVSLGGRGTLQEFSVGGSLGLIRQYRRGGLARFFLRDKYLLHNRPLRELNVLQRAHAAGVSVPEPLGVVWKRTGPTYSGAIATLRLEGVTLLEYLRSDSIDPSRIEECGRAIRTMHDSGIYHADLQLENIIVGPFHAAIIDFDNARIGKPLSHFARSRNLLRLRRSFAKNGVGEERFSQMLEGYGEFQFSCCLAAAYGLKDTASDTLAGRRPKRRYRTNRHDLSPSANRQTVQQSLDRNGDILKESDKFRTRRVGRYVIKESNAHGVMQILKATFLRKRYRRAWDAANYLQCRGILVPAPIAYAESGAFGIVTGSATVSEFLDGYSNVEDHARSLDRESPGDRQRAAAFLSVVADAVNALNQADAYHSDLSGKNIFTADGRACYFIDLEAVYLNRKYTRVERMKNHIQLYDSFCDLWDDELLGPFIANRTPSDWDGEAWFAEVREGQRTRRARHLDANR